jgi:outer membrane protein OmpA-like peptidoglycan-associated protein
MQKIITLSIFYSFFIIYSRGQSAIAIVGGVHNTQSVQTDKLPASNNFPRTYSPRKDFHLGFLVDMPLSARSAFTIQPGLLFNKKGRDFVGSRIVDTTVFQTSGTQFINYIDIPFNFIFRKSIGKNKSLLIGAGPYASFFYKGRETSIIRGPNKYKEEEENTDFPVGKGPGKYKSLNYGLAGLVGLEFNRFFLTANYNSDLNCFYTASDNCFTQKHQIFGVTFGFFIDERLPKNKEPKSKNNTPPDKIIKESGDKKVKDRDFDGVPDKDDKCPDLFGSIKYKGCPVPDSDGDGINDEEDKCPDIAGFKRFNGCPIPDKDGDGVNDEEDKCPTVPGLVKYKGCPIPDSDGDGINDEEDKCPDLKGNIENNGCPIVIDETLIQGKIIGDLNCFTIYFDPNRIILNNGQFSKLEQVVQLLKNNSKLQVFITGHTEKIGTEKSSEIVSANRAETVKKYLLSYNIKNARIKSAFYGSKKPAAGNEDPMLPWKNRRVEICLYEIQ